MSRPSNRDRILDAFETHVINEGVGSLTLEGVAERAGVSKGGLLYHFPTKVALFEAFGERMLQGVDAVIADAPADPVARVAWYLDDSLHGDRERRAARMMLAALHAHDAGTADVIVEAIERFHAVLDGVEPHLAELVRVVGDGIYLHALLGLASPETDAREGVIAELIARAHAHAGEPNPSEGE